jgi:excisionase family DNA binding protein
MLLDEAAAAEFLNTTPRTLQEWRHERRIPFVRLGHRTIRYDADELAQWIKSKTVRPHDDEAA